ncbi:heat shock transcription factor, Y-linked-like [Centrocercus urophasianus]|uniref:heat shock transcription factor, Y-linked-like n=1 Tax=Centrocercus urophasianus TaxID=9002 RepID=UPI001C650D4E|nr:heat shock transcription factor, Y-linked-like [Centrocercus urophasianus]
MVSDMGVHKKQRCGTECFHAEKRVPVGIHERLLSDYGDQTVDVSTERRFDEEKDSQTSTDEEETKYLFHTSEESTGKASIFSTLSFPQNHRMVWVGRDQLLAVTDQFESIWRSHNGKCVVLDEEMFQVEVLRKRGPLTVRETESMKSLVQQLNLYGFTKMPHNFRRPPSLPKILSEEEAFTAHRKLLLHTFFRRDHPKLFKLCKKRVARKRRDVAVPFLHEDPNESHLRRSPSAQSMYGAAASGSRSWHTDSGTHWTPATQAPQESHYLSQGQHFSNPSRPCCSNRKGTVPFSGLVPATK